MGSGASKKAKEIKKAELKERKHSKDIEELTVGPDRQPPKGARRQQPLRKPLRSPTKLSTEFVPYEAENLKLEGDWEIEKGVDVSTVIGRFGK